MLRFQERPRGDDRWAVNGTHYARTLRAWLERLRRQLGAGAGDRHPGQPTARGAPPARRLAAVHDLGRRDVGLARRQRVAREPLPAGWPRNALRPAPPAATPGAMTATTRADRRAQIQPGADASGTQKAGAGNQQSAAEQRAPARRSRPPAHVHHRGARPRRRAARPRAGPRARARSRRRTPAARPPAAPRRRGARRRRPPPARPAPARAAAGRGQRVGVADRARDQDPQRVAPVGVMALVRDDRGQLGRAQAARARPRTRTRAGAAARRRTPAARRRARSARCARRSRAVQHRQRAASRRCAATPRQIERSRAQTARQVEERERDQQQPARVELPRGSAPTARRPARRRGSGPRRARTAARAGTRWPERGDRELGPPQSAGLSHRSPAGGASPAAPGRAADVAGEVGEREVAEVLDQRRDLGLGARCRYSSRESAARRRRSRPARRRTSRPLPSSRVITVSSVVYARIFSPRALSASWTSRTVASARPHISSMISVSSSCRGGGACMTDLEPEVRGLDVKRLPPIVTVQSTR